jgi:hypothetical protein
MISSSPFLTEDPRSIFTSRTIPPRFVQGATALSKSEAHHIS